MHGVTAFGLAGFGCTSSPMPATSTSAKPLAAEAAKPAATPLVIPASAAFPQSMPAMKTETAIAVSPLVMPVIIPRAPEIQQVSFVPKPSGNAARVLKMLEQTVDLTELCRAVNALTAADLKEQPKLTPALLKAAEYPSDTVVRVACLKAVARGRDRSKEVAVSLERLSHDADAAVAAQAILLIQDQKAGR